MTSVELRYYNKLAKLLHMSKADVSQSIIKNWNSGLQKGNNRLLNKVNFSNKALLERYINEYIDLFDSVWLFVYDAKDFGPIELDTTILKHYISSLIENEDEIFTISSRRKESKIIVDIDQNDGDVFDAVCEVYG